MGLIRAAAAVVVGILLAYGLPWVLERVLVESVAGRTLYTAGDYYMVRNTAGIIAARLAMALFLSVLAGHVAARVAKEDVVRTVGIAASALTLILINEFTVGEFAWGTPIWMRVALVVITGPAMVLGAFARAAAAELEAEQDTPGAST
jgi:hypothetical protein